MKYFLALFMVLGVWNLSEAAMCGDSEYFEYQFKPLSAKPVKPEDVEHAHGRCGMGEKHCELMFMINGKPKCKKTKQAGNGIALMGPDSKNDVSGREFNPHKVDWTVHSDWELSKAYEHPLIIQLCDHDSAFRGGHDQIISESHQHLEKGCHQHTKQDDHKTHPWVMKYELCCRPIAKQGFFRGQKGGK